MTLPLPLPTDNTDSLNLTTLGLRNGCNVFVWDGAQVGGVKPCTGPDSEPILLTVYYPSQDEEEDHRELCKGFPRKLTLQGFKVCVEQDVWVWVFVCVAESGIPGLSEFACLHAPVYHCIILHVCRCG